MRVYISGPITGKSREEVETTFFRAEMKLRSAGHEVINPAKIEHWKLPWKDYMLIAEIIIRGGKRRSALCTARLRKVKRQPDRNRLGEAAGDSDCVSRTAVKSY